MPSTDDTEFSMKRQPLTREEVIELRTRLQKLVSDYNILAGAFPVSEAVNAATFARVLTFDTELMTTKAIQATSLFKMVDKRLKIQETNGVADQKAFDREFASFDDISSFAESIITPLTSARQHLEGPDGYSYEVRPTYQLIGNFNYGDGQVNASKRKVSKCKTTFRPPADLPKSTKKQLSKSLRKSAISKLTTNPASSPSSVNSQSFNISSLQSSKMASDTDFEFTHVGESTPTPINDSPLPPKGTGKKIANKKLSGPGIFATGNENQPTHTAQQVWQHLYRSKETTVESHLDQAAETNISHNFEMVKLSKPDIVPILDLLKQMHNDVSLGYAKKIRGLKEELEDVKRKATADQFLAENLMKEKRERIAAKAAAAAGQGSMTSVENQGSGMTQITSNRIQSKNGNANYEKSYVLDSETEESELEVMPVPKRR